MGIRRESICRALRGTLLALGIAGWLCMSGAAAAAAECTLTVIGEGAGGVSIDGEEHELPWSVTLDCGSTISLEAAPDVCWTFGYWLGDVEGPTNPLTVTLRGDMELVASFVSTSTFSDVACDHWAFEEIESCYEAGLVAGYPDGMYRPQRAVGRDEMAVYVSRGLAGGEMNVPTGPAEASFPDIPTDHWAYDHIEYALGKGIVAGYPDGLFHGERLLSRGQMAVFIARSVVQPPGEEGLAGYSPPPEPTFPDVPVDFWSYLHVEYLSQEQIVQGYPDGRYRPSRYVTRDQMAAYMARAFGLARRMADAVWLGTGTSNPWIDPAMSETAVHTMLAELDGHGIHRLFVNIGVVNAEATDIIGYSAVSDEGIRRFLESAASYEAQHPGTQFQLLADLCIANGEAVGDWPACATDLALVRGRIATLAAGILQLMAAGERPRSFDGIHFDAEPAGGEAPFDRLLSIFEETRASAGEAQLSAAAPRLQSAWDAWPQESNWCWTEDQYRTAAGVLDEIAPMLYVAPDAIAYAFDLAEYQAYVSDQVVSATTAVSDLGVAITFGVPTYWPSDPGHDERMDLPNTLTAVVSAVEELEAARELAALRVLGGVALFRYELMRDYPHLWDDYEELWGSAFE